MRLLLFLSLFVLNKASDTSGAFSLKGRRPYQEDEVLVWEASDPSSSPLRGVYAVFDGHGGWRASHIAKKTFMAHFLDQVLFVHDEATAKQAMAHALKAVEQSYVDFTRGDENPFEGTTAVVAVLIKDPESWLLVANVGDSRAMLCHAGVRATALTRDHKPNDPVEQRRIEALGGVVQQRPGDVFRVGGLAMSRAIGDTGLGDLVPADPDFTVYHLGPDSYPIWLIVASDGLWDVFSAQEACDSFGMSRDTRLSAMSEWLAWKAYNKGSSDNISVVLVNLN